jgi:hypothetical protein
MTGFTPDSTKLRSVQGKLEAALARVAAYDEQHASLIDDLARMDGPRLSVHHE